MPYRHTQHSHVGPAIAALASCAMGVAALATGAGSFWAGAVTAGIVAIVLFVFSALTTTVEPDRVVVAFRPGWPRRTIARSEIVEAEPGRNSWWYGWGIRLIPKGQLWNVWGLDAVKVRLVDGRQFSIGTDEPEALADAINGGAVEPPPA